MDAAGLVLDGGTETSYIEPGSPWEKPFVEFYNARMRDELLAITEFCDLNEATVLIEDWRDGYNTERPHSSLGYLTPLEFHRAWTEQHQPEPALSQRIGPRTGSTTPTLTPMEFLVVPPEVLALRGGNANSPTE